MNESQIRNATESELLNYLSSKLCGLELLAFKKYSELMDEQSSIAENSIDEILDLTDRIKSLVSQE